MTTEVPPPPPPGVRAEVPPPPDLGGGAGGGGGAAVASAVLPPPPPGASPAVLPPPPPGATSDASSEPKGAVLPPPPAVPVLKTAPASASVAVVSRPPALPLPPSSNFGHVPPPHVPPPPLASFHRPPPPLSHLAATPPPLSHLAGSTAHHHTPRPQPIAAVIDLDKIEDDGSFNPLLDPNYTALQLSLAQAVERDPEGAAEWYAELCNGGPRAMVKKIVEGIVPGNPALNRTKVGGSIPGVGGGGGGGGAGPGTGMGAAGGGLAPGPPGHHPPPIGKPSNGLPQRPGAAACIEFVKTGECSFGMECPYHHP